MKKLLLVLAGVLIMFNGISQSPTAFKYQAVIRDNLGNLITEQAVNFQIDILKGSVEGTQVYSETHAETTTTHGLVTLEIGTGTTSDDFSAIEWGADSYFLTLWVDGDELGTTQLLSVPYALHAETASTLIVNGQIKNVSDPTEDQDVATKAYVDQQITYPGIRIQAEVDSIVCFGDQTGAIDLTITGGTPPYMFEWDNGSSTEDISSIGGGKYQVYVEDNNGLTSMRHFTLHQPDEILISYSIDIATGGIDVSVSGGTPPYTYLWSNGSTTQDLTGMDNGTYTVTVTDAIGCTNSEDILLLGGESSVLVDYLEDPTSPAANYANTSMPAIKTADHVRSMQLLGSIYIIDIRAADDYNAGHIEGSVNVAMSDVLTHLDGVDLSAYDEVSIVDYTGQAAGWAASLLRLMGYDIVFAMKWGLCSWHADFSGSWQSNISNARAAQFTSVPTDKGPAVELPTLNTGFTTGQDISEARVQAVLAEGFGAAKVSNATVFGDLENYYIVNYWPEAEYLDPGHIPGAIQYTPKVDLASDAFLNTLPTDKTLAVYGYTGQASAHLAAYLRVIGYDAVSIVFGANGMIYDQLTSGKWSDTFIMDYPYVVSP